MAQLCVTLGAPTLAELRERRDLAAPDADLVEVRLDTVADPDVAGALAGRTTPVVVTCRAAWEGGHFRGSEEERLGLLRQAWQAGAEFVDVEFAARDAAPWIAETGGERLILSSHDFAGVPHDLEARHRAMCAEAPAVVKIAVTVERLAQLAPLARLRAGGSQRQIVLAMGRPGLPSRLLPDRFGSAWTYAGDNWAPGQLPASVLRRTYRFGQVSSGAALYGVVARPSSHSVSPDMHNAAFAAAGLDAIYLPLEAADVDDLLAFADDFALQGASVTLPFKVDVLPRVDADALSRRVGAVNTLTRSDGRWMGTNTDVAGLLAPLAGRMTLQGARAAILGTGGAARGAAVALSDAGTHVTVIGRDAGKARGVASLVGGASASLPPDPGSWDLLVNATPAGMYPATDETPWPDGRFDGTLVYDLIYNPRQTRLLRDAAAAGCATLDGLPMLVAQAEAQFTQWTGRPPAPGVMLAAAEARLATFPALDNGALSLSRS